MDKETIKKGLLILTGIGLLVLLSVAIFQTPTGSSTSQTQGDPTASPEYQMPEPPPMLSNGTKAPDFTLSTIDGESYTLSNYAGKKPVLVELLSTACPHCQHSTTTLKELVKNHGDGLQVLAINAGDTPGEPSTSKAFVEEYGLTYPLLEAPSQELMTAYRLYAFPAFYLVNKSGIIIWGHRGTFEETAMASLEEALSK